MTVKVSVSTSQTRADKVYSRINARRQGQLGVQQIWLEQGEKFPELIKASNCGRRLTNSEARCCILESCAEKCDYCLPERRSKMQTWVGQRMVMAEGRRSPCSPIQKPDSMWNVANWKVGSASSEQLRRLGKYTQHIAAHHKKLDPDSCFSLVRVTLYFLSVG